WTTSASRAFSHDFVTLRGKQPLVATIFDSFTNTRISPFQTLEWQTMLASVLDGDVLKSEKTRIATALASSDQESNNIHINIWLEIRVKVRGKTEEEERKKLEECRLRTVDHVVHEVLAFHAKDIYTAADPGAAALGQVNEVIRHLDVVHSLYPNLKVFQLDKLIGSEMLNVSAPGTGPDAPQLDSDVDSCRAHACAAIHHTARRPEVKADRDAQSWCGWNCGRDAEEDEESWRRGQINYRAFVEGRRRPTAKRDHPCLFDKKRQKLPPLHLKSAMRRRMREHG
ncbi:hypothetical protein EW146_g10266, partial [Bondarzewia mesenterica]